MSQRRHGRPLRAALSADALRAVAFFSKVPGHPHPFVKYARAASIKGHPFYGPRRSIAVHLLDAGRGIVYVADYLGHRNRTGSTPRSLTHSTSRCPATSSGIRKCSGSHNQEPHTWRSNSTEMTPRPTRKDSTRSLGRPRCARYAAPRNRGRRFGGHRPESCAIGSSAAERRLTWNSTGFGA